MTSPSLPTRIEAILYLKGRPVSIGELAELAELQEGIDQELKGRLSLLETFHFALPDEAFTQTYETIAWPARVARAGCVADVERAEGAEPSDQRALVLEVVTVVDAALLLLLLDDAEESLR